MRLRSRGERIIGEICGRKFGRTNPVAAQNIAPMRYPRHTDAAVFECWFEERLMPLLPAGSAIIMDSASFRRKGALRNIASRHGVMALFLPDNVTEIRKGGCALVVSGS